MAGVGHNNGRGSSEAVGVESTANEATRNFILGLPQGGPAPGSADAASLQAAEAFVGEIQQEILAYDIANARAMEAYAQSCWAKVPFFGKRWAAESLREGGAGQSPGNHNNEQTHILSSTTNDNNSNRNSDAQREIRVERTSADAPRRADPNMRRMNSWLFKRRHPGWVPLIQRWWVPCVCVAGIALIWTPDVWKLRSLYWCDHKYALFRQAVHKAYWRATMSTEDYTELMRELELGQAPTVDATKCPL